MTLQGAGPSGNSRIEFRKVSKRFAPQGDELGDDLPGRQVALESTFARGAEIAAHGAPGLRREAARGAVRVVVGHENRLHRAAIVQAEQ